MSNQTKTKVWQSRPFDEEKKQKFLEHTNDQLLAHLLSQRSIELDRVKAFLSSSYQDLSHPHDLKGTKEAAELFCKHALNKSSVAISGDYDADGIISSAMLKLLCDNFNLKSTVFLPSRTEHGYGLSKGSIQEFKSKFQTPPDLLIITDCGSSSEDEIKELKTFGIKNIIIIDHHIINEEKRSKSADVLINWHTCNYNEMCACGEVYQFIRAIRWITKKVNPNEYMLYAAVGTIGDVSPIVGDNRIIVKNGLSDLSASNCGGMLALFEASNINPTYGACQEDIKFKIVPRINAVGRIGRPDAALDLLTEHDIIRANDIAKYLTQQNLKRKEIQSHIEFEAHEAVKKMGCKHGILLINPEWNIGVIGIVASYLVKEFKLPAIVMGAKKNVLLGDITGDNGSIIKGSGRSFGGINLKEILDDCKEMFVTYGGHAMAAGVTLKPEFEATAHLRFEEACKRYYEKKGYPEHCNFYDMELEASSVTFENARTIGSLYPYCDEYNPEPIFKLSNAVITGVDIRGQGKWKLLLFSVDGISLKFKMFVKELGIEISNCHADIYFTFPQILDNPYSNQLMVVDLQLK